MRLQRSDDHASLGIRRNDIETAALRGFLRGRRRRSVVARRSIAAMALALAVTAPALACTQPGIGAHPGIGIEIDGDGRRTHVSEGAGGDRSSRLDHHRRPGGPASAPRANDAWTSGSG